MASDVTAPLVNATAPLLEDSPSTSLSALIARVVTHLNKCEQKDDLLFVFSLTASLSRAAVSVTLLAPKVPSLADLFASLRDLLERSLLLNHVKRLEFSILLKAAYELLLMALCQHYFIAPAKAATALMDRLQLLKPYIQPPSRMNCFFELKELVNYAAHPKDATCSLSMAILDDSTHAFLKVLDECVTELLRAPPRPLSARTPVLPHGTAGKAKTQVCSYWQAGNYCPFAARCRFAHGEGEVRSAT